MEFLVYDQLAVSARSKIRALKSHSHVKIINNNNGLIFYHEIFLMYSVLSLKFIFL